MSTTRKGVPRPNRAQIEQRQDRVVLLRNLGYWSDQIAGSLGVSETTVFADLLTRKADVTRTVSSKTRRPYPNPEKYDWMTLPEPEVRASHWITGPMPRLEALRDWLVINNARNQFSFNLAEAEKLGDAEFRQQATELVADLSGYLDDLGEILTSEDARRAAASIDARDDMRPGTALVPRSVHDPARERTLPGYGTGTTPGRVYQAVWAEWFAGHDIFDPQVLARVASTQGCTPNRARRAAAELAPLLRKPA